VSDTWSGVWIAEDIALITDGVRSGSWVDTSLGVVSAGLDGLALATDPLAVIDPSGRISAVPSPSPFRISRSKLRLVSISRLTTAPAACSSRTVVGVSHRRHCPPAGEGPPTGAADAASTRARNFEPPIACRPTRADAKTGLIGG